MPKTTRTAIIAYVPVLHAGYKRLFDTYPNADIYVLGEDIIALFDQLRKELRALKPQAAVGAIAGWGRKANVIDLKQLADFDAEQIVMPDEDISYELAEKYFRGKKIEYATIFLRWDRRKMETQNDPIVATGAEITRDDKEWLRKAAELGKKSSNLWRRMGAILVKEGKEVSSAFNYSYPSPHQSWIDGDPRNNANRGVSIDVTTDLHAEAGAITKAAKEGVSIEGASMYVLDFPCQTCAKLVASSGIAKLYYHKGYAVLDGQQALDAAGVEIIQISDVELPDLDPTAWVPYPEKKK